MPASLVRPVFGLVDAEMAATNCSVSMAGVGQSAMSLVNASLVVYKKSSGGATLLSPCAVPRDEITDHLHYYTVYSHLVLSSLNTVEEYKTSQVPRAVLVVLWY